MTSQRTTQRPRRRPPWAWIVACVALWGALALLAPSRRGALAAADRLADQNRALAARLAAAEGAVAVAEDEAFTSAARASELRRARRDAFLSHTAGAVAAWREGRWSDLQRHLDAVPDEHLGWEWFHLALRRELAFAAREDHDAPIVLLARASGAGLLASCDEDGDVRLWSAAAAEPLARWSLDAAAPCALALDAQGLSVALGLESGELRVCASRDGATAAVAHVAAVPSALAFAPAGELVFVGDAAGGVWVWRLADGLVRELEGHGDGVTALAVAPDGGALASGSRDGDVRLFRGPAWGAAPALLGHDDWVRCLAFDAAGARLASGGDDARVIVRDARGGAELERLEARAGPVVAVALPGAAGLAYVCEDGTGRVHESRDTLRVDLALGPEDAVLEARFAPDGGALSFLTGDAALHVWRRGGPRPSILYPTPFETGVSAIDAVAESRDGALLAAGGHDGALHVFERASGRRRFAIAVGAAGVRALAFAPGDDRLAAGSRSGDVCVVDAEDGALLRRFELDGAVASLAFTEDGASLLAVGLDGAAQRWDVGTGAVRATLPGPPGLVFASAAGADGAEVFWIGDGGTVRGFDVATGARRVALRDRDLGRVEGLALSPDGRRVALIENGLAVVVLGLAEGAPRSRGFVPDRSLRAIAIDPYGERVVTGSYGGTVDVWDAASGAHLLALDTGPLAIRALAFSPDGARLLTGTARGLELWEDDLERIEAAARSGAGR